MASEDGQEVAKCRDCRFAGEAYVSSYSGAGLYKFTYCQRLVHDCRLVEPDIERECEWFEGKDEERVTARMARARAEGHSLGRKPLNISSQIICDTLQAHRNVGAASKKLGCSVPYLYKILRPLGLSPAKVARGEQGYPPEASL